MNWRLESFSSLKIENFIFFVNNRKDLTLPLLISKTLTLGIVYKNPVEQQGWIVNAMLASYDLVSKVYFGE